MSGTIGAKGLTAEAEVSFGDILANLQLGGLIHVEAQKERWSILFDGIFLALGQGLDVPPGRVDIDHVIVEFGAGYEVVDSVELLAGGRYVSLDTALQIGFDPGIVVRSDQGWVDPIVGVRVRRDLSDRWQVHLRSDIGGFGVGSDFTWNLEADVGLRVTERLSMMLGYRLIDVDYDTGTGRDQFLFDAQMSGPRLGMAFRF